MAPIPHLPFASLQCKHKDTLTNMQLEITASQSGASTDIFTLFLFNTGISSSNYYAHKLTLIPLIMKIAYKTKALFLDLCAKKLSTLENYSRGRKKCAPLPELEMTLGKVDNL